MKFEGKANGKFLGMLTFGSYIECKSLLHQKEVVKVH